MLWSTGATTASVTVNAAGNYTVTNTVNGCRSAAGVAIAAPVALPAVPTATVTQPTCTVATGTITVTSPKTGLTFSITGSGSTNTTGVFTLVVPGSYSLTATNAAGCISNVTTVVVSVATNCASIGNFVFRDNNGNGIQNVDDPGIAGVTVRLLNSANSIVATSITDNNGAYNFAGLVAATYGVSFVTPVGFSPTLANTGTDDTKDSDPVAGTAAGILLNVNEVNITVDAGFIPSILVLGNRVWYDTDNNGINSSTENGMRNISMRLYRDIDNNNVADGAAIATTTTDANGNYSFANLAPGNYIVGAVLPAGYVSSNVNAGDPDNNINNDDNGVVQAGNEIRGLAITLSIIGEPEGTNNNTNNSYDFGMLPNCNCVNTTGNLLVNGSFENGITGWLAVGGSVSSGTGYVACGIRNGFNVASKKISIVYQDVTIAAGTTLNFSGFAGTHAPGLLCSPKLSLIFRNAAGAVLSQTDVAVTNNVDLNFGQLALYSITATAPAGTTRVRVQSSVSCDFVKMDAFCLRVGIPGGTISRSNFVVPATTDDVQTVVEKTALVNEVLPVFEVKVSPNPFINFFEVVTKAKDNNTRIDIKVLNSNSKLMYIQKTTANSTLKLHTQNWTSGVYFVEITQGVQRKVLTVVKL